MDCSLWVDAQSQSIEISWDYIYRIFVDGKVEHDDEVSGGMKVLGWTVVRRGFRFTSQATTFPHWMGLSLREGLSADLSCWCGPKTTAPLEDVVSAQLRTNCGSFMV